DRDPARLLLRRRVDRVIRLEVAEVLGDRRRQRRLAVVDMADRANVHMRLRPLEFCLRHPSSPRQTGAWNTRHGLDSSSGLRSKTDREKTQPARWGCGTR